MVSVLDASVQDGIAEEERLGGWHTTERAFFSSQFGSLRSVNWRWPEIYCLVRVSFLVHTQYFLLCPQMDKGQGNSLSGIPFINTHIRCTKVFSWRNYHPMAPLSSTITLRVRISTQGPWRNINIWPYSARLGQSSVELAKPAFHHFDV